jgi:glutathione synthase
MRDYGPGRPVRRLLVVMDPIDAIDPGKDSTLAMLLEAQRRSWSVRYAEAGDLWLRDGVACGRVKELRVADEAAHWHDFGASADGDFDVILQRKDPPIDLEYLYTSYILDRAEVQGALVVNRPQSLRDANEKAFVSWFPEISAPTLISRSIERLRAFVAEHARAVVKPLNRMGGRSVFVTNAGDPNLNVLLETMTEREQVTIVAQRYLPEITTTGDTRILLIDGEPAPTALVRMPQAHDHRGNISAGATTELRPLTPGERHICEQLGPVLRQRGLIFVGIDVIGDLLTEINVTSATGIRELERDAGHRVSAMLFDALERLLRRREHRSPR